MRIAQTRQFIITLDDENDEEHITFDGRPVQTIKIWTDSRGEPIIVFGGNIGHRDEWSAIKRVESLNADPEGLLWRFLNKLDLVRVDDMTAQQFMSQTAPVG